MDLNRQKLIVSAGVEPVVDEAKARSSGPETRFAGWKLPLTPLCSSFEPFKFDAQRLSRAREPFTDTEQLLRRCLEPFKSHKQLLSDLLEPFKSREQPLSSCCERFTSALERADLRGTRSRPAAVAFGRVCSISPDSPV